MYVLNEQEICEVSGGEKAVDVLEGLVLAQLAKWAAAGIEKGIEDAWNWVKSLF